jgi:hypothetical protein
MCVGNRGSSSRRHRRHRRRRRRRRRLGRTKGNPAAIDFVVAGRLCGAEPRAPSYTQRGRHTRAERERERERERESGNGWLVERRGEERSVLEVRSRALAAERRIGGITSSGDGDDGA